MACTYYLHGQLLKTRIKTHGSIISDISVILFSRFLAVHWQKWKSTIDCATCRSWKASCGPLRNTQPIVFYSRFIELCTWAYGTIYSWQQEMDLYQSSVPAVFATIPTLCTIPESPLQILLESVHASLLESLLEGLLGRASHRKQLSFP